MNKNEIIKLLKPRCNGYDLPLSLNIELIADLLVNKQKQAINFTGSSLELKGKYTQNFIDYVDKFFKHRPKVYEWVSKDGKREFTHKGLCKMYEKAMNESPLIT